MKYIHGTTKFYSDAPTAVTLGKFDGLHRGHQKLLREIIRLQKTGYRGVVFTIAPEQAPALLTEEEKRHMLETAGIDTMICCPYLPEILSMEPEAFISSVLVRQLQTKHIVVGTDFRFGRNRSGGVELLEALRMKYGYGLTVVEKECCKGREISSTRVREALQGSDMELVEELLGYPFTVRGVIQHGRRLGRQIGMPTINLVPEERKLLPPPGVYYSRAAVRDKEYCGVTNIGYKPTVDGSFLGVETYLYGTDEEMYGCEAEIRIGRFRRPERRFASVEELKKQMERDIQAGKEYFGVQ